MSIRTAALLFTLGVSPVAFALQDRAALTEGAQANPEEIVITGIRLRKQVLEAEQHAYDVFNQFNDEKRFRISCSTYAPTGTRLEQQVCRPEFVKQATQGHAVDSYDSWINLLDNGIPQGSVVPTHAPMEVEIARQQPAYKLKLKQVAEQHPEFVEAIKQYTQLKERFEKMPDDAKK